VCSGGDGEVKFFSMDGAATGNITRGGFVPHDVSISRKDSNEIVVAYVGTDGKTRVWAECVPGQQCAQDNSTSELGVDLCTCVSVALTLLNIIIRPANRRNRVMRVSCTHPMGVNPSLRLLVAPSTVTTSGSCPGASSASSASPLGNRFMATLSHTDPATLRSTTASSPLLWTWVRLPRSHRA
jgi:hypothetical protein